MLSNAVNSNISQRFLFWGMIFTENHRPFLSVVDKWGDPACYIGVAQEPNQPLIEVYDKLGESGTPLTCSDYDFARVQHLDAKIPDNGGDDCLLIRVVKTLINETLCRICYDEKCVPPAPILYMDESFATFVRIVATMVRVGKFELDFEILDGTHILDIQKILEEHSFISF